MGKFNPLDFGYELVRTDDAEGVFHYQKIQVKKASVMTDVLELAYWNKQNAWVLFIELMNLKQFLPKYNISDEHHRISLFMGRIKSNQDFRFVMNKIIKDPSVIAQMGC